MCAEVNAFRRIDVWIPRNLPKIREMDRTEVGKKRVFKMKHEPNSFLRHKSRIVVLGYFHIPGLDCMEKFSSTAIDTSTELTSAIFLPYADIGWICDFLT